MSYIHGGTSQAPNIATMVARDLTRWRKRAEAAEARAEDLERQLDKAQRAAEWHRRNNAGQVERIRREVAAEVNAATERVRTLEAEAAVHVREIQRIKAMYEPDGMPRRPEDVRLGKARIEAAAAEVEAFRPRGRKAA